MGHVIFLVGCTLLTIGSATFLFVRRLSIRDLMEHSTGYWYKYLELAVPSGWARPIRVAWAVGAVLCAVGAIFVAVESV